jgi:O-acetylhomoserine (thiol)-lyase
LESNPYHPLAQKYLPDGVGGVVSFGIRGGREAATRFMDGLQLAAIVTHVADARTCVLHPASTTHRAFRRPAPRGRHFRDLVRLSVGIEHVDDILADLDQALAAL